MGFLRRVAWSEWDEERMCVWFDGFYGLYVGNELEARAGKVSHGIYRSLECGGGGWIITVPSQV